MRNDVLIAAMVAMAVGVSTASAQTDLSAGKSAAQLFSANCAACHRSPAGLARGRDPYAIARFLTEHYTTRSSSASALANYLTSVRGAAPPPQQQQPQQQRQTSAPSPGAPPASNPAAPPTGEATASAPPEPAGPVPTPTRRRPFERINNATAEHLRSLAAAADSAVPLDPAAPDRGRKAQVEAYAAAGTAPDTLRQTAISAAVRQRPVTTGAPRLPAAAATASAPQGAAAGQGAPATADNTVVTAAPATAAPAAGAAPRLQFRGPPASGASPSMQSNTDVAE